MAPRKPAKSSSPKVNTGKPGRAAGGRDTGSGKGGGKPPSTGRTSGSSSRSSGPREGGPRGRPIRQSDARRSAPVAKGLGGIKNTICPGKGLHQTVETQVFINKQCVERWGIKTGKKHPHNNQQINILVLNAAGQIAIIILEPITIDAEIRFEICIVITNGCAQELLCAAVHGRYVKAFILNITDGILLYICSKGKDRCDLQGLRAVCL